MSKITLDPATAAALSSAELGTEFVGPDGQPLGAFVPQSLAYLLQRVLDERRRNIDEASAEVTLEELEAADAAGGEIPHDEAVRRLGLDR